MEVIDLSPVKSARYTRSASSDDSVASSPLLMAGAATTGLDSVLKGGMSPPGPPKSIDDRRAQKYDYDKMLS